MADERSSDGGKPSTSDSNPIHINVVNHSPCIFLNLNAAGEYRVSFDGAFSASSATLAESAFRSQINRQDIGARVVDLTVKPSSSTDNMPRVMSRPEEVMEIADDNYASDRESVKARTIGCSDSSSSSFGTPKRVIGNQQLLVTVPSRKTYLQPPIDKGSDGPKRMLLPSEEIIMDVSSVNQPPTKKLKKGPVPGEVKLQVLGPGSESSEKTSKTGRERLTRNPIVTPKMFQQLEAKDMKKLKTERKPFNGDDMTGDTDDEDDSESMM